MEVVHISEGAAAMNVQRFHDVFDTTGNGIDRIISDSYWLLHGVQASKRTL